VEALCAKGVGNYKQVPKEIDGKLSFDSYQLSVIAGTSRIAEGQIIVMTLSSIEMKNLNDN